MKTFLKRNKIFLFLWVGIIITLVFILLVPIGTLDHKVLVFYRGSIIYHGFSDFNFWDIATSPFTIDESVLFFQTIVFALLILTLIVSVVLFIIRWKKEHPTKMQRMQSQIDDLQKQVDDLTSTK